jgi:hypothetical protein
MRIHNIREFIASVQTDILAMKATDATAHTHKICCSQKLIFNEFN